MPTYTLEELCEPEVAATGGGFHVDDFKDLILYGRAIGAVERVRS